MPADDTRERSPSGVPIYRYEGKQPSGGCEVAPGDDEALGAIDDHLNRHLGGGAGGGVFHELVSSVVHIDVHIFPPTPAHHFTTLVTSGMSDLPMAAPRDDLRYAELLLCLPPSWPVPLPGQTTADFSDERIYWPIRWLKKLARFPHQVDTWLGADHTIPSGDPAQPFAADTQLCCILLDHPRLLGADFNTLAIRPGKTVNFYSLIPLYREEMDLKLNQGAEALHPLLDKAGVTELLDARRPNVCARPGFWPFGRR